MNKHTNRAFSVIEIIIVLFVVILIGAVAWVYFNNYNKAAKPTVQPTTNQDSKTDTNNTTGSVSNIKYKTYKYSYAGYNFEFEYPDNWTVTELIPGVNVAVGNEKNIIVARLMVTGGNQGSGAEFEANYKVLDSAKTNIKGTRGDVKFGFIYTDSKNENLQPLPYEGAPVESGLTVNSVYSKFKLLNSGYGLSDELGDNTVTGNPLFRQEIFNDGIHCDPKYVESGYGCGLNYVTFGDQVTPTLSFDSEEAAKNFMNTDEYKQIKRMIMSLKY